MAISPWARGQLSPTWTLVCMRDSDAAMDLTGVTAGQLSLAIYNSNHVLIGTGAGTFTLLNAYPAWVRYAPASADVDTTGTFYVRVVVDYGGTTPDMSDYMQWVIEP